MKDFKKILSVFALTTFVIIALGFIASTKAEAGLGMVPLTVCDKVIGPAVHLCDIYCDVLQCDDSANQGAPRCQAIANGFYRLANPNQTDGCGSTIPCGNVGLTKCVVGFCPRFMGDGNTCVSKICSTANTCI